MPAALYGLVTQSTRIAQRCMGRHPAAILCTEICKRHSICHPGMSCITTTDSYMSHVLLQAMDGFLAVRCEETLDRGVVRYLPCQAALLAADCASQVSTSFSPPDHPVSLWAPACCRPAAACDRAEGTTHILVSVSHVGLHIVKMRVFYFQAGVHHQQSHASGAPATCALGLTLP